MLINRWDPFFELSRLHDEVQRMAHGSRERSTPEWLPLVDIREQKDAFVLTAALPGVRSEDVKLSIDNNLLTLAGERRLQKEDGEGFRRVENSYGSFSRSFALPSTVATEGIEAGLENGILTVRIPKRVEATARTIPVNTSAPRPVTVATA